MDIISQTSTKQEALLETPGRFEVTEKVIVLNNSHFLCSHRYCCFCIRLWHGSENVFCIKNYLPKISNNEMVLLLLWF